jgi:cytidylate kinase
VRDLDYEAVAADIARRDALDQGREHNPLTQADDAVEVDTTDRSIEQIVDHIMELLG